MVKAFGIGFLARPRSEPAADAREAPGSMLAGMTIAAAGLRGAGGGAMVVAPALRRVLARDCRRAQTWSGSATSAP